MLLTVAHALQARASGGIAGVFGHYEWKRRRYWNEI